MNIDNINLLKKNYNEAVERARLCAEAWVEAGKPRNGQLKEDYDKACETSRLLLHKIYLSQRKT